MHIITIIVIFTYMIINVHIFIIVFTFNIMATIIILKIDIIIIYNIKDLFYSPYKLTTEVFIFQFLFIFRVVGFEMVIESGFASESKMAI
jgi:hypothetical protein